MATQFAAIIIGTGQSGPALAARLSATGKRVATTVSELVPTMLGELRPLV